MMGTQRKTGYARWLYVVCMPFCGCSCSGGHWAGPFHSAGLTTQVFFSFCCSADAIELAILVLPYTYASGLCTVRLVSDCMSFWQIMFELVRAWRKCRAEKLKAQKFSFGQMGGNTDMSFEGSKATTYGQERAAQSDFALQSDPAAGSFA